MTWAAHLPALQVVVPLLAAPLTVLVRRRDAAFAVALTACWIAFAIAVLLWLQVDATGVISYAIGRWRPPLGIEYRVDRLTTIGEETDHIEVGGQQRRYSVEDGAVVIDQKHFRLRAVAGPTDSSQARGQSGNHITSENVQ